MDIGSISLLVSAVVGFVTILNYFHTLNTRKESVLDKFAKAASVENELENIRNDLKALNVKCSNQQDNINELKTHSAVSISQISSVFKELDKISEKIDQWRDDE